MKTLLVVGLGEVGESVLSWVHDAKYERETYGIDLYGMDSSIERCRALRDGAYEDAAISDELPEIAPDVISVCVPCDQGFQPLRAVLNSLTGKYGTKPLYSVESTLPAPMAEEHLVEQGYVYDLIAYPHRVSPHDPDLKRREAGGMVRVMGGKPEAIAKGIRFWAPVYGRENIHVTDWPTAILSKMLENARRFVEIATTEQEAMIAKKYKVDPYQLQQAMQTKWNMTIPTALDGIGRHCLPKDVRFAETLAHGGIYRAAAQVDTEYREALKA